MGEHILVGVDSGGTRTNVRICHSSTQNVIAHYEHGSVLDGALPPGQYTEELQGILAPIVALIEDYPQDPIYLVVGAAGFRSATREHFRQALNHTGLNVFGPRLRSSAALNDAVALASAYDAHGAVIAGTGSIVILRTAEDDFYQLGGHDWVACDQGSGFWIAMHAIRLAYRHIEHGTEPRPALARRLFSRFDLEPEQERACVDQLYSLAIARKGLKGRIACFAQSVCDAATKGDLDAQNIVKREAEELADLMAVGLRRCRFGNLGKELHLVECGGLMQNTFYSDSFKNQLQLRLGIGDSRPDIRWTKVGTGMEAVTILAQELASGGGLNMQGDIQHRPVLVEY